MVNMNTVSSALKNFYIMPLREDVNLKADAFASRIMRTSTNIVGYNKIVRAALVGANGGAGSGSETGALPASGENVYVNLESDTKTSTAPSRSPTRSSAPPPAATPDPSSTSSSRRWRRSPAR